MFKVHFLKSSDYFHQCNLTFVKNILSRHTVPSFKQFYETTAWLNEQVLSRLKVCRKIWFLRKSHSKLQKNTY